MWEIFPSESIQVPQPKTKIASSVFNASEFDERKRKDQSSAGRPRSKTAAKLAEAKKKPAFDLARFREVMKPE